MPIVLALGGALGVVAFAATRKQTAIERAPVVAAQHGAPAARGDGEASRVTPEAEASVKELERKYVDGRSKELLGEFLAGAPSSEIDERTMASLRATAREQAAKEWRVLSLILGVSWDMGRTSGDAKLYERAGDLVWSDCRDLARLGAYTPDSASIRVDLERAADRVRLERRIDSGR